MCTLKIKNIGNHTIVWTQKNTTCTDSDRNLQHCCCCSCALPRQGNPDDYYWSLLYEAILCSRAECHEHCNHVACDSEWVTVSFLERICPIFNIHHCGVLTVTALLPVCLCVCTCMRVCVLVCAWACLCVKRREIKNLSYKINSFSIVPVCNTEVTETKWKG